MTGWNEEPDSRWLRHPAGESGWKPLPLELIILIGLQAAGKSTFYRERFATTHVHVSKDLMRNNRRPERRQRQLVTEALQAGRSVVVDNTNPSAEVREPLIEIGKEHGARIIGYFFPALAPDCAARNRLREGRDRVPDVALFATAKRLEPPTREEGFDRLYRVSISCDTEFHVVEWSPTRHGRQA